MVSIFEWNATACRITSCDVHVSAVTRPQANERQLMSRVKSIYVSRNEGMGGSKPGPFSTHTSALKITFISPFNSTLLEMLMEVVLLIKNLDGAQGWC